MKRFLVLWGSLFAASFIYAQHECRSFEYQQQLIQNDPSLKTSRQAIEDFLFNKKLNQGSSLARIAGLKTITIPVIIHILYHYPGENISDDLVQSQIAALNRDYRKLNPDTTRIPGEFKSLAADCGIEFKLATVDSAGRASTAIIHKYTPVTRWTIDDKIKFSSEMGDDAWNANSYLNIWVGTIDLNGYSSSPGDPANKDGIVISNTAFGITNSGNYGKGRTAVHEVGHWLGLRHLWGDANCGDDGIADTPKQQTFTSGCPSSVRVSCGNGPYGDMYMDYMDFTNDDCLVMFTEGQKQKMLTLFEPDGPRNLILSSNGLGIPLIEQYPLPETSPQWLHIQIFPNPVTSELTLNMDYDARWIGKELKVFNVTGQLQIRKMITAKTQKLDVSNLKPGIYFISAEKEGEKMLQKFVKL